MSILIDGKRLVAKIKNYIIKKTRHLAEDLATEFGYCIFMNVWKLQDENEFLYSIIQ